MFNEALEPSTRCPTFTKHVETVTPPMSADPEEFHNRTVKYLSNIAVELNTEKAPGFTSAVRRGVPPYMSLAEPRPPEATLFGIALFEDYAHQEAPSCTTRGAFGNL